MDNTFERMLAAVVTRYGIKGKNIEIAEAACKVILSADRSLNAEETVKATLRLAPPEYNKYSWTNFVYFVKKFYSVPSFSMDSKDNYLAISDEEAKTSWKDAFNRKIAQLVQKEGKPVVENPDSYSWRGFEALKHFNGQEDNCTVVQVSEFEEVEWDEFEDTETDNSMHAGFDAKVKCACGWYDGLFRYENDSFWELMRLITDDPSATDSNG